MTGKERVETAMRRGRPDRVPVFCQLSLGHYMIQSREGTDRCEPYQLWYSPQTFSRALVRMADRYEFDGLLVNLPGRPRDWRSHIVDIIRGARETVIRWDNGGRSVCPDDDNVHYYADQSPGNADRTGRPSVQEADPSQLFYIEPHNITGAKYPFAYDFGEPQRPGTSAFFPDYVTDTLDETVRLAANRFHVTAEVFSPFTQFLELFGYTEALTSLITEPERCERILERLADGAAALALLYARHGADALLVSSAFAGGGFISRSHYRRFVQPWERLVVEQLHAATDIPVYVHTCGRIGDRIDLLAAAGYDGIDTMDPPPLGDTDIGTVKQEFGDRLFLKGNVDPVNVLLNGGVRDVHELAVRLIKTAGPEGYILSSACSVAPHVDPLNILELSRASKELA